MNVSHPRVNVDTSPTAGASEASLSCLILRTHYRAISEIDTPSDLRSRRISAQSSTISICFLQGSTLAGVTRELVNFSSRRSKHVYTRHNTSNGFDVLWP